MDLPYEGSNSQIPEKKSSLFFDARSFLKYYYYNVPIVYPTEFDAEVSPPLSLLTFTDRYLSAVFFIIAIIIIIM